MQSVPLAGILVLLVDDDEDTRELLRHGLVSHGAAVVEARDAVEARAWLADWTPSVVVCDVVMPDEDGIAFLERLRADGGPVRGCRAIALSGADERPTRARAMAAGFDAFVSKSSSLDVLSAVVRLVDRTRDLGSTA